MGQAEQDYHDRTARIGKSGQDRQKHDSQKGQAEQDIQAE
jgi:hypothetical protein